MATTAARWEIGAIEVPGADTTACRSGSRTSCAPRSAPWIARRTTPTTPSPAAAVAALGAVTRHLTSATKSVGRRVSSGNAGGPAAAAALARTQGNIVDGTVGLFDGASDPIVAADAATLKAALDGRDALVAGILALADHSQYGWALGIIARDAASEAQDIAETLTDDTLTDAAKAALTAAQAQATATATAAQAGAGTSGPATGPSGTPGGHHGNVSDDGGQRDCPPGQQRRQGGDEGGTPEEAPAAPAVA